MTYDVTWYLRHLKSLPSMILNVWLYLCTTKYSFWEPHPSTSSVFFSLAAAAFWWWRWWHPNLTSDQRCPATSRWPTIVARNFVSKSCATGEIAANFIHRLFYSWLSSCLFKNGTKNYAQKPLCAGDCLGFSVLSLGFIYHTPTSEHRLVDSLEQQLLDSEGWQEVLGVLWFRLYKIHSFNKVKICLHLKACLIQVHSSVVSFSQHFANIAPIAAVRSLLIRTVARICCPFKNHFTMSTV